MLTFFRANKLMVKVNKKTKLCRGERNILPWDREEVPPNEWPSLLCYILTTRRDALVQNNRRRFIMKICCCCCFSTSSPPFLLAGVGGAGQLSGSARLYAGNARVTSCHWTNQTRWWTHGVWMLCLKQPFKSVFLKYEPPTLSVKLRLAVKSVCLFLIPCRTMIKWTICHTSLFIKILLSDSPNFTQSQLSLSFRIKFNKQKLYLARNFSSF